MEVPKPLQVALELARLEASGEGDCADFGGKIADLLAQAVAELATVKVRVRGVDGAVEYIVETLGGIENLVEYRLSGRSKPFRCPKTIYEALVRLLSESNGPLSTEEIMAELEKVLGFTPPEHQVRVPLRLFMALQPTLLIRDRARYGPTPSVSFTNEAIEVWNRLRTK